MEAVREVLFHVPACCCRLRVRWCCGLGVEAPRTEPVVAVTTLAFVGLLLRCFSCVRHELVQAVLLTSALSVLILAQVPVCLLPTARWRLRWSRRQSRPTYA